MRVSQLWENSEGKIVCNELRRQNLISFSDWIHDSRYCAERMSITVYRGYRVWAIPCLKLMRRYPVLARGISVPASWYIEDVKFALGVRQARHWRGRLLRYGLFVPGSWLLGQGLSVWHSLPGIERPAAQGN
ncbi:hypothetical protein NJI34_30435 [Pseudomonas sp. S 311-6]|nr:hypothetical protein [Pseudomonas sp. S 311-6]